MRMAIKRFSLIMMAAIFMVSVMTPEAFAASSVSISGGDNIKGGDTFYLVVNFEGGDIGRVDAQMTYDTNKLTYISGGTSDGNVGYINLSKAGTGGGVTFSIKFQAVADGSTEVNVITYELYDVGESFIEEAPQASKTITIQGDAAEEEIVTQETSPDKPVEYTGIEGVDEKEESQKGISTTVILIISAAALVILIIVISLILAKKRKKPLPPNNPLDPRDKNNAEELDFLDDGFDDDVRVGRSGRPLDLVKKSEEGWLDDLMGSGNIDRSRDRQTYYKKRASEETEVWDDWNVKEEEGYEDIDKW